MYKQDIFVWCFTGFYYHPPSRGGVDAGVTTSWGYHINQATEMTNLGSVSTSGTYTPPVSTPISSNPVTGTNLNNITPNGQLLIVFYIAPNCSWSLRNAYGSGEQTAYPGTPLIATENTEQVTVLGWNLGGNGTGKFLAFLDTNTNNTPFHYTLALLDPDGPTPRTWDPQITNNGSGE